MDTRSEIDNLMGRATALLGFLDTVSAVTVLVEAGEAPDMAFLAVQAAAILVKPVVVPAAAEADVPADDEAAWLAYVLDADNSDYLDRKCGREF